MELIIDTNVSSVVCKPCMLTLGMTLLWFFLSVSILLPKHTHKQRFPLIAEPA